MARITQDIYRSREKDRGLSGPQGSQNLDQTRTWFLQVNGSPWPFLLLLTGVILTLLALSFLVHMRIAASGKAADLAVPLSMDPQNLNVRTVSRLALEMDPHGEWILDDLDIPGNPDPVTETPPELTAHWVKQAGIQIRYAELAFRDKNWKEAIARYRQAQLILPGISDLDRRIGIAHLRQGEFSEAQPRLETDAARNPESAPVRSNLGVARMGQSQFDAAETDFQEAIRLDPRYAPARHNLALLYFQTGRMEEALDALDSARLFYPDSTDLLHMKAVALIRLQRWPQAALLLEESAQKYPETPHIQFRLAEVRANLNESEGAMDALKKAISLVDARRAMLWITRREFDPLRDRPEFEALAMELSQSIR